MDKLLFCNIAWMKNYKGINEEDKPVGGGSWVETENDAVEKYNFKDIDGSCYGYVQIVGSGGAGSRIGIERLEKYAKDKVSNVLVVWLATKPESGGSHIVGWYKDAIVYRELQEIITNNNRYPYRIKAKSENVYLVKEEDRQRIDLNVGQAGIRYGHNIEENLKKYILEYIEGMEEIGIDKDFIEEINSNRISGEEKNGLVKLRVGQGIFRQRLLKREGKCKLCGVRQKDLLISSHIKSWKDSDGIEKLDVDNGLLLCPNHDKLFDLGYISFDEYGQILISEILSEEDRIFMNVNGNMAINLNEKEKYYMTYHRENIFKDK